MPWDLFWTCLWQIIIFVLFVTIPLGLAIEFCWPNHLKDKWKVPRG